MSSANPAGRSLKLATDWLATQQQPDGEIPWFVGGKMDPWDHVQAAMGLASRGLIDEARAALVYMTTIQEPSGGWCAERRQGEVVRGTLETNHAAYLATGAWFVHQAAPSLELLRRLWPAIDRAIDFVVSLQEPSGAISWAVSPKGKPWRAPLITGSSSIHGSLVCAIRIAELLGHDRPRWHQARAALAHAIRHQPRVFLETDLPEPPDRHSMDWYYPVLGGAVRGAGGAMRLLDAERTATFVHRGVGCRCVADQPWYTVAETCELVLAYASVGLHGRAATMLSWVQVLQTRDGAFWTGVTHPDRIVYPEGERTTWTAATVLLAADAVQGTSQTSRFFEQLAGHDLDAARTQQRPSTPTLPERAPALAAE